MAEDVTIPEGFHLVEGNSNIPEIPEGFHLVEDREYDPALESLTAEQVFHNDTTAPQDVVAIALKNLENKRAAKGDGVIPYLSKSFAQGVVKTASDYAQLPRLVADQIVSREEAAKHDAAAIRKYEEDEKFYEDFKKGNLNGIQVIAKMWDNPLEDNNQDRLKGIKEAALLVQKMADLAKEKADDIVSSEFLQIKGDTDKGTFMENPSFKRAAGLMMRALPSLLGGVGVARFFGPVAGYLSMSAADNMDVYNKAREKGVSQTEANLRYGLSVGTTFSVSYALKPLEKIIGTGKVGETLSQKIVDGVKKTLVAGSAEGLEEGWQTFLQNFWQIYDVNDVNEVFNGVIEGAIGGLGSGAVMSAVSGRHDKPLNERMTDARNRLKEQGATDEEIDTAAVVFGEVAAANSEELNDIPFQTISKNIDDLKKFIQENEGTPEARKAMRTRDELLAIGTQTKDVLIAAGRTEELATAESKILQGIALWGSEESGLSPMEYFNQRFPQVRQARFADFEKKMNAAREKGVNVFEALLDPSKLRGVKNANKGMSLLAFLKKNGGLKDEGGDLKAMDAGKEYVGLVSKTGQSLDDAALRAWEAGYFPEFNERPSVNDLLDAVRNNLAGNKTYSMQNMEDPTLRDAVDQLSEQLDMLNIDTVGKSAKELEEAYNKATAQWRDNEAAPIMAAQEWDDVPFQTAMEDDALLNRTDKTKYLTDEEVKAVDENAKRFKQDVSDMIEGKLPKRKQLIVLNSLPSAYKNASELYGKKLLIPQDIYKKIIDIPNKYNKNHNVDRTRAVKLSYLVADPNYILQSTSEGHEDRFVIVTNSKGRKPASRLSVIVQPGSNAVVVSGYDEIIDISEEKKAGRVVYDKKKELETKSPALNARDDFNSDKDNISLSDGYVNTQYQTGRDPNAAFADRTIWLFENANESSFMHETAHWFKNELTAFDTERSRLMLSKVSEWENAEFAKRYKTDLYNGRYVVRDTKGRIVYDQNFGTEEQAREYAKNELFARGFEQYLKEGKAPNNYLKQAFRSFWNWLRHLYRTAKSLNVELNDSIRDVYGNIIGGEDLDFYLNESAEKVLNKRFEMTKEKEQQIADQIKIAVSSYKRRNWYQTLWHDWTDGRGGKSGLWTKIAVPLSTRAGRISQGLKNNLREYDYSLKRQYNDYVSSIKPFLDIWAKMTQDDAVAFDLALKNSFLPERNRILKKYNAEEEFKAVTDLLETLYIKARNAGVDIAHRPDYFPRQVDDVEGLLTYFYGEEAATEFERAKKKAGFDKMTLEEQDAWTNKYLRGYERVDLNKSLPGNVKKRSIDIVTAEINQYYKDSMSELMNYIDRMNNSIQSREFFGYDIEAPEESIGAFVNELVNEEELKVTDIAEAENILRARFKQRGVHSKFLQNAKNMSYVWTMGGVNSAITQLDDLSSAFYKAGLRNTLKAITSKNLEGLSREDLGVERIGEEFQEGLQSSKLVNQIFKMTGLDKIDGFGKNTLVNALFMKFQEMDNAALRERIEPVLGTETNKTITDIKEGRISENVKLLMFNELSDMQPISLSEMPEYYLTTGNGRVFYMLKTFTLKRFDIFRNECFDKIRNGNAKEGYQNLFKLAGLMLICGMAKDNLIDWLYGRDVDLSETFINNLLGLFGLTKYQLYQTRDEGVTGLAAAQIPPLFSAERDLVKDLYKSLFTDKGKDLSDYEVWKNVPILGRFYYWWLGGGKTKLEEKKKKKLK